MASTFLFFVEYIQKQFSGFVKIADYFDKTALRDWQFIQNKEIGLATFQKIDYHSHRVFHLWQYRTKIVRQMRRQIFRQMKQKAE